MNIRPQVDVPELEIDAKMLKLYGHTVSPRGRLERRVIAAAIAHLQQAGFTLVSVDDGEEDTKVTTAKEAMELVFNLDECRIYFRKQGFNPHNLLIVLGNDGWDAISDYTYTAGDPDGFEKAMDAFDAESFA